MNIQDMSAEQIGMLLSADCGHMSLEQAAAIHEFIENIGGLENARSAVAMLSQLEAQ